MTTKRDREAAEIRKLDAEAAYFDKRRRVELYRIIFSSAGPIAAAIIALFTAYAQYEKRVDAEQLKAEAITERETAVTQREAAIEERERAEKARLDAENYITQTDKFIKDNFTESDSKPLVFVRFRGSIRRETINTLRDDLRDLGYTSPGAERTENVTGSYLQYTRNLSADHVGKILAAARQFAEFNGCDMTFDKRPVETSDSDVHVELNLAGTCE